MNKETFIKYMEIFQKNLDAVDSMNESMKLLDPDFNSFYLSPWVDLTISLIKNPFLDDADWTGYYVFELDMGKSYKRGMVKGEDGKIIKLKTFGDLWELLEENRLNYLYPATCFDDDDSFYAFPSLNKKPNEKPKKQGKANGMAKLQPVGKTKRGSGKKKRAS